MCLVGMLVVRQSPNPSQAWDIPQVHAPVPPTHGQTGTIRGKADGESTHRSVGERDEGAASSQLPEITPLPSTEIFLAGLRTVTVQQPARFAEIVQLKRLLGEIHVRRIKQSSRLLLALEGLPRLGVGALLLSFGILL